MSANKFNTNIPDKVIDEVLSDFLKIEKALAPYTVTLTETEKKHMPKIADKTISFAEKVDGYLDTEPKYNPPYIDVAETHKDLKNFQKLLPVIEKAQGVEKIIGNISVAAGSDALVQFLAYYSSVKKASEQGVAGSKTIYDELAKRFPGRPKPPKP